MRFNLAAQVRRPSRRPIDLPIISTSRVQADDLAVLYMRVVGQWKAAIPLITSTYETALAQRCE